MTISRITTWVDGQVLTAAALNGEFDNIINNPVTLVFPIPAGSGALDLNYNPVNKFVVGLNGLTTVEGGLSVSAGSRLLLWNDGTTNARIMGPNAGISRVAGLQGTLISNIGSFTAERYQLQRSGTIGNEILMTVSATSSFSINTQTAGPIAGGRDQAAAFASDNVYFYAFANGPYSTSVFGICSTRPPTLGPSVGGGEHWAYLGSATYDVATSAIPAIAGGTQRGSWVTLPTPLIVLLGGTASSETVVSISSAVPTQASQVIVAVEAAGAIIDGFGLIDYRLEVRSSAASVDTLGTRVIANGTAFNETKTGCVQGLLPNSGTIAYIHGLTNGSSGAAQIAVRKYQVSNGDN